MRATILGGLLALALLLILYFWRGGVSPLITRHHLEGVFSPAYDPDGTFLYFFARETRGTSHGPGWEHFTPPTWTRVASDVIALRRLDLAGGEVEELVRWPESPISGRTIRTYRNRVFTVPRARLRVVEDSVEYRFGMSVPRVPTSEQYRIQGVWRSSQGAPPADWEDGQPSVSGYQESPLNGRWEAIAVPGPEGYPAAIAAFDEQSGETRVLVETDSFARAYPEGVPLDVLTSRSRRDEIERIATLERTREELLARFRGEGLSEGDAAMRTIDEMRRLGFYPPPTTITARLLAGEDRSAVTPDEPQDPATASDTIPLFSIAEAEMRSGIFPDIEEALTNPGTPVEKRMGRYVIHRDYDNSAALNAYLQGSGTVFRVEFRGARYELTVRKPER